MPRSKRRLATIAEAQAVAAKRLRNPNDGSLKRAQAPLNKAFEADSTLVASLTDKIKEARKRLRTREAAAVGRAPRAFGGNRDARKRRMV